MIKLVISDIDGTLIDSSEQLSDAAFALRDYLRGKQVMFSLATGRVYELAAPFADALDIDLPFVSANGAALTWRGNKEVARHTLPFAPFAALLRDCDAQDIGLYYSETGYESIHRDTPRIAAQKTRSRRIWRYQALDEEKLRSGRFEKLCLMDWTCSGIIADVERQLRTIACPFSYVRYVDRAIEIVADGRTKARGIADLAAHLGIGMDEVMCIGDDSNDLEMLAQCGISAAPANALPAAKACADYVAAADHAQGVLEAVRHYLK